MHNVFSIIIQWSIIASFGIMMTACNETENREADSGNESSAVYYVTPALPYYITGTVFGSPKGLKLYLYFAHSDIVFPVDSGVVNEKGGFEMNGKVAEYGMYVLSLSGRARPEYIMFPLDTETVHIEFTGNFSDTEPFAAARITNKQTAYYAAMCAGYRQYAGDEKALNKFLEAEIMKSPLSPVSVYFALLLNWENEMPFLYRYGNKLKALHAHGAGVDKLYRLIENNRSLNPESADTAIINK